MKGFTLIEVVAALSLLAMVTATSFIGFQRHSSQIQRGQKKLIAVQAADQLLHGWYAQGQVPVNAAGTLIYQNKRLHWQTELREDPSVARIAAKKCRLTIRSGTKNQDKDQDQGTEPGETNPEDFALVTIEILVDSPTEAAR